jgi:acetylornithine deacetylase
MARSAPDPSSRALIERLVSFDTTSHKSNLDLIVFVRDYLAGLGIAADLVHNDERTKAGLLATIGPLVPGGVVLSGHTDVVPVEGQTWQTDPFRLSERDGRLYGRGTCDMKGFIAVVLAMVPEFLQCGLKVPLHLALSYDEEIGCLGAPPLIQRMLATLPRPSAAIIGEPSEMNVIHAHKGIAAFLTTATGKPAHSSQPALGANAIFAAGRLLAVLERLADEERANPPPGAEVFDPAYVTFNAGVIQGGQAVNIIAQQCRLDWECRPMPGRPGAEILARFEDLCAREILPMLRSTHPGADIHTKQKANVPPLVPMPGSPAEQIAFGITGRNRCHTVAYTAEAGLFQSAGIPSVICGPGSIAQAHQPDEFVAIDQIEACEAMLRALALWSAAR